MCFDKINEFDHFRELCATSQQNVRILSGLPSEDEDTTVDVVADPCDTGPNAAEDTNSLLDESSINSNDNEMSPVAETNDGIDFPGLDT